MSNIPVFRKNDVELIEFIQLLEKSRFIICELRYLGFNYISNDLHNNEPLRREKEAIFNKLIGLNRSTISQIHLKAPYGKAEIVYQSDYEGIPFAAKLKVNDPNNSLGVDSLSEIVGFFEEFESHKLVGSNSGSILISQQAHALDNLTQLTTRFTEQLAKASVARENLLDEEKQRLEGMLNEEKQRLESAHHELELKLRKQIDEREAELNEREKSIDDRNNTHARRELRNNIIEEVREKAQDFKLGASSGKARVPIKRALILLMLLTLAGVIFYTYKLSIVSYELAQPQFWVIVVKQILTSVAFLGTTSFYIRWQNLWSKTHTEGELELRKLYLDMERASWIVETAFEWKSSSSDNNAVIPDSLIGPITHNLFGETKKESDNNEASDQLASALLGSAAAVKLKTGDSEVSIDRKGLKNMGST